jgi:hypothetical protein
MVCSLTSLCASPLILFFLAQLAAMRHDLQAAQGAAASGFNANNTEDTLVQ